MDAAVVVPCFDLTGDIALLEGAGFLLTTIFPADEPRVAVLAGLGVNVRLDTAASSTAPVIRVRELASSIELSGGATLEAAEPEFEMPPLDDTYVFTSGGAWGEGRAGMEYRDLIPERHGGRVIASHIRIAEPGPVPDYVHHHDIRFQMIYCRRGRVEVIYEDQGDAFWMEEGDCVLQPPHIRHRVLASDNGCEVVEIASPAEHPTFVEHEITLPTASVDSLRDFGGQRFSFDRAEAMPWLPEGEAWESRSTGIAAATSGMASVKVLRPSPNGPPSALSGASAGDLCMLFVLEGEATVTAAGVTQPLRVDDSVAVKTGDGWSLDLASPDFRCLYVELETT